MLFEKTFSNRVWITAVLLSVRFVYKSLQTAWMRRSQGVAYVSEETARGLSFELTPPRRSRQYNTPPPPLTHQSVFYESSCKAQNNTLWFKFTSFSLLSIPMINLPCVLSVFRLTLMSELSEGRQVTVGPQQHPALNLSHTGIIQDPAHQMVHQVSEGKDPKDVWALPHYCSLIHPSIKPSFHPFIHKSIPPSMTRSIRFDAAFYIHVSKCLLPAEFHNHLLLAVFLVGPESVHRSLEALVLFHGETCDFQLY